MSTRSTHGGTSNTPFPSPTRSPPAAIRRPSSLAGLPAYDIYLLSDSTDWPTSSTYTFTETVLGSLADNDAPENGIDLTPSP